MTNSPLLSTDPDALNRIFSTNPLDLTDDEILRGVVELRRRRNVFASEEAAKSLAPKKARTKPEPATSSAPLKPVSEIDLDDLV